MKERFFMDRCFFNFSVTQNPCNCHPFDLLIETKKNGIIKGLSICGLSSQREVDNFLSQRFIFEYKGF
jgi:hypothetical protein